MSVSDPTTFREIPQAPGYSFGDDGSVWSSYSYRHRDYSGERKRLATFVDPAGYHWLRVRVDGKPIRRAVHHFILWAFAGPKPEGMEGRHLDGNPGNNRPDNLAWGTHVENMKDKDRHGTSLKGRPNGKPKLTADQVREIRSRYATGNETYKRIAADYGVSSVACGFIITRKNWAHVD